MDTTDLGLNGHLVLEHTLANDSAPLAAARTIASQARATGLVALFASTLFLSAFLSFAAEPMVAKMVLPILGGAAPTPEIDAGSAGTAIAMLIGGLLVLGGLRRKQEAPRE